MSIVVSVLSHSDENEDAVKHLLMKQAEINNCSLLAGHGCVQDASMRRERGMLFTVFLNLLHSCIVLLF